MIRILISLTVFVVTMTVLQLAAVNLSGGVGGTFGIRPVSHRCIGIPVDGATTSALPTGDWGFSFLLDVRYYMPQEREGVEFCLGQDIWMGE